MSDVKTMEEVLRNGNTSANQGIKRQFIEREVYCSVNSLVEYCLKHGYEDSESPVNLDDIENYYAYPEYYGEYAKFSGGTEEQRDAEIERLRDLQNEYDKDEPTDEEERIYDLIRDEISELEALESQPQDIYEWWAVSPSLYEQLKEQNECVVDAGSCYVWGRGTSGQAILLDHVITVICAEMEILEGQQYSWAKK